MDVAETTIVAMLLDCAHSLGQWPVSERDNRFVFYSLPRLWATKRCKSNCMPNRQFHQGTGGGYCLPLAKYLSLDSLWLEGPSSLSPTRAWGNFTVTEIRFKRCDSWVDFRLWSPKMEDLHWCPMCPLEIVARKLTRIRVAMRPDHGSTLGCLTVDKVLWCIQSGKMLNFHEFIT